MVKAAPAMGTFNAEALGGISLQRLKMLTSAPKDFVGRLRVAFGLLDSVRRSILPNRRNDEHRNYLFSNPS